MQRTSWILGLGMTVAAAALQAGPIVPTYTTFGTLSGATFGGSGIPNDAVAIFTYGNVTLGLTAHQRYSNPAVGNNGAGDFYAVNGGDVYTPSPNTQPTWARWNFGWYVQNSDTTTYILDFRYDFDPGAGTDEAAHGVISSVLPGNLKVEDSWNLGMGFLGTSDSGLGWSRTPPTHPGFDPNAAGEYTFALILRDMSGQELGRSAIRVNVVPDAGATVTLLGLGLMGLSMVRRRS
ncbi:MAG: hypothetical protein KatS3mg132_754 [Limisphaera sp.]|nr:MAG: hypothetical protein KatS3mg132_754 [Limisphaera sp.]